MVQFEEKTSECLFRFRAANTRSVFSLDNYPFESLLQKLAPRRIIMLIQALLLERKVVLV